MNASPASAPSSCPMATARRLALVAFLCLFCLGQFFAPLLHAHVSPRAAGGEPGIHLPVAVASPGGAMTHVAAMHRCEDADEGAVITAPPEHRRDDASSHAPDCQDGCVDGARAAAGHAPQVVWRHAAPPHRPPSLAEHPPARAPPHAPG